MNTLWARIELKWIDCLRNEDSIKADAIALKLRNQDQGEFSINNKKTPFTTREWLDADDDYDSLVTQYIPITT